MLAALAQYSISGDEEKWREILLAFESFDNPTKRQNRNVLLVYKEGLNCAGIISSSTKDGILRERREHARGRNLADCGRICGSPHKSVGSIEEMWQKYSK